MACNFGWDWGIATYTERHLAARAARVVVDRPAGRGARAPRPSTRTERASRSTSRSSGPAERPRDVDVAVSVGGEWIAAASHRRRCRPSTTLRLAVPDAELWWPAGYGEQPLYDVDGVAARRRAQELDARTRRVGFRTVRWDTTPDAAGTPFTLVVNDQPVFVKGVELDPRRRLPRAGRPRPLRAPARARPLEANLNLIRVWGGGIYESDDFYDLCDELGLLTWQDFLFACAAYPEEEPLRSEVEAEARDNVARLADHPSLVLLTGNNENLWGYEDWGWKTRLDGKTWGACYYYDLLPAARRRAGARTCRTRPGSPWSVRRRLASTIRTTRATTAPCTSGSSGTGSTGRPTATTRPRFVAEFGWQGPPDVDDAARARSATSRSPPSRRA